MDNLMLMVAGSTIPPPDVTPPTVASLAPATAPAGSPQTQVVITGTNFDDPTQATFGGINVPTVWNSATQLTITVPADLLASAGNRQVRVGSSYKIFSITAAP